MHRDQPHPPHPRVETTRADLNEIYESALVEVRPPHSVDSAERAWRPAREVVRERAMPGCVMTAWNPGQERPSREVNELANTRLRRVLEALGEDFWEADGFSPDRTFREPGFIVWNMPVAQACDIAAKFGQYAIFYFDEQGNRSVIDAM